VRRVCGRARPGAPGPAGRYDKAAKATGARRHKSDDDDPPPQVLYPILVAGTVFLYPAATKQQSIHVSQLEPEDEQEQDEQADQEQAEEDDHHSDYSLPDCKRRRHK
jgi:hypothetical protein